MRRSISCSSTICSGAESADSGLSTCTSDSVLGAPSCTPSGWPFGPLRSNIQPGQYARNGILASLKQAVVPADSFEAYQQLTTSKKGSPCTSACGPITPSRLLQDIQAQNQAALAQVKHTLHSHTRYWPIQRPKQASPSQHWNWLEESNADVEVDVECCGESGAASKICSLVPGNSALFSRTSTVSVPTSVHSPLTSQLSLHPVCAPVRVTPNATHRSQDSVTADDMPMALTPRMPHAGSALSEPQASSELLFRLNHARQTVGFVDRQVASARRLCRGSFTVWEALEKLSTVNQPGCPDPHEPNLAQQALQTAEVCRLAHPQQDWLHLVALIHELGKLLAHTRIPAILKAADVCNFGPQPDWAVFSESFPVGCAFHCNITYSQFFSVNPDRRRWLYNTSTGMYQQGCGLSAVQMSWTASEYLHQILSVNKTFLPPTAQFVLRYCNFLSLTMPGQAYDELLSEADVAMLPWLYRFLSLKHSSQQPDQVPVQGLQLEGVKPYYDMLIAKYIPGSRIRF